METVKNPSAEDRKTPVSSESKPDAAEADKNVKQDCCCDHDHAHDHEHEEHSCGCGHDHEHEHEEHSCCCGHDHDHEHEDHGCCCGHDHDHQHEEHDCCCGHNHEQEHEEHGCCCGHDHSHVENSMDTEWDVSELDPSQHRLLFATLATISGIKDVGANPDGLTLIHTPEALPAIKAAFAANNLKLKLKTNAGKQTSQIRIAQMDCPTEEGLIRKKLKEISGVSNLQFNLMNRILTVSYPDGTLPQILEAIRSLNYDAEVLTDDAPKLTEFKKTQIPWWKFGIAFAFAAASEACELLQFNTYVSMTLALIAIVIIGLGTYKKGFIAVKNFNFNMNALMAVAVTGAFLIGSWPEAAMVMVLFELSEAIEQLSLDRARGAIRSLLSLAPEKATIQNEQGQWQTVEASQVKVGDIVRVEPGERLAVDGTVTQGSTTINQSAITGESMPIEKSVGSQVFAGTLNENGEIQYKATSTAQNSMPARIISAIESAQSSRAPTQRFVDSFAKVYTPLVFVVAIATALIPPLFFNGQWLDWIYKALTLLVIACPCALVISTPVTIVTGLANAARRGILIKGGIYLEKGRHLTTLALDKTGTITQGNPSVQCFECVEAGYSDKQALLLATALADRNSHPVSQAVSRKADQDHLRADGIPTVNGFFAIPGQGVVGSIDNTEYYLGNMKGLDRYLLQNQAVRDKCAALTENGYSPLILASAKHVIAYFGVADSLKEHSKEAIARLHELGVKTVMLTGDNEKTAERIASEVGVKSVKANLLPEQKQNLVNRIAKKEPVGMVGDGINDAPALARADIGFAMGAMGTDAAIETADVALMDDDLRKLPQFIELSRQTYKLLVQNIAFTLTVKAIFFVLTYMGLATMWMAVFADTGTCLIVVANGLRLMNWKPSE